MQVISLSLPQAVLIWFGKRGRRKGRPLITHISGELLMSHWPFPTVGCCVIFDSGFWDAVSKWWYFKSMRDVLFYQGFVCCFFLIKVWYYSHHEWQVPVNLTEDNFTISRRESTILTTLVKLITKYKLYLQSVLNCLPSFPSLCQFTWGHRNQVNIFGVSLGMWFKTYFIALLTSN